MEGSERDHGPLPIDATPIQVCAVAVGRLAKVWDEAAERIGQHKGEFIERVFGALWRDGDTGAELEEEIDQWSEQPEEMQAPAIFQAMLISCAYACQGMKAQNDGDLIRAWQYTAHCEFWAGVVIGVSEFERVNESPGTKFAKIGAAARHNENRAMKAQVLEWYAANADKMPSKDAAAAAMAGKLLPVTFRTVRNWLKGV